MADIKLIARALVLLAYGDRHNVAKVAEMPSDEEKVLKFEKPEGRLQLEESMQQLAAEQRRLEAEQKRKRKPYAPRSIGKPRGFPKNMRRK